MNKQQETDSKASPKERVVMFEVTRCGNVFLATGDGWEYKSLGNRSIFTQYKKIPSIRIIKTLVKKLKET